jgi:hypothetical protein
MMPLVQNMKRRLFLAIELRANLFEIEVSEVDCISNEIKLLLSFTLFKTVHYIFAEKKTTFARIISLHLRLFFQSKFR